jgi:EmrB/QacA subfamily drug resistance transporter
MDHPPSKGITLLVTTLTSFLGPFMISSVNIALPAIQSDLQVDAVALSWVATAYLLAVAAFLVPVGKFGDIHGRKRVFAWGLGILAAASLFAAAAGSVEALILARIVQGAGAAMVVTTGMPILISVYPLAERGRAIGLYVAAVYVGLSVGPPVGGFLTQQLNWRWIFLLVAPLLLAILLLTVTRLGGEWAEAAEERLDGIGCLLYAAALVLMVYGASRLPSSVGAVLVGVGVAALAAFVRWELRVAHPVFEVRLFTTNRVFAFSSLAALIHYAATFAVTFLMSLYLQFNQGLSPRSAGLLLVAQPVMMALFSPAAGRWSDRWEPRVIASTGMALTAAGLLALCFLGPRTPLAAVVAILAWLGLGFALFSSPNTNAIMTAIPRRYYGIASGAVATMRLLGQMLSMAVATVAFALVIGRTAISPANADRFLTSARACFVIFTVLCAVGVGFSLCRGRLRDTPPEEAPP